MEDKSINAGKVGLTMGGDWKSSESYEKLTCVSHNGRSWAAKKNVSAGVEPSEANSAFWQLMSDRGVQGIQGPVGPQGNSAFDGIGVEIVNNLTQGGESAVLSAEQGKVLKTELTELESEVRGIVFTSAERNYYKIPTMKMGVGYTITMISTSDEGTVAVYGKTSPEDSSYQMVAEIKTIGSVRTYIPTADINYIKIVNSAYILAETSISIVSEIAIMPQIDSLHEDVTNNLNMIASANSDIAKIERNMNIDVISRDYNGYAEVKPYYQGEVIVMTLTHDEGKEGVTLYGKSDLSESSGLMMGQLTHVGQSIRLHLSRDINYVTTYSTGSGLRTIEIKRGSQLVTRPTRLSNLPIKKTPLKVLDIGNSYSVGALTFLSVITNATNKPIDASVYYAFRASGSFKSWVDCYNDADSASYTIAKSYGDSLGIEGAGAANNGSLFRNALSENWDIIMIHPVSSYANDYIQWRGNGEGGYLSELIRLIKTTNPQALIGYLMPHSYASDYAGNTEQSSGERWLNIIKASKEFVTDYGIDFIIPYGTAVQKLRMLKNNDLSEDGTHLGEGLGKYVASCCYYEALFAPINGVSVLGNTYRATGLDESISGRLDISDANAALAQNCAIDAICDMWDIYL